MRKSTPRRSHSASGQFDFVLSLYVLHHAMGYRAALAEIARVLKPGGCLLVIDLVRPEFLPQLPASVAPEGVLTKPEWLELFKSSGFGITRWQTRYFLGPLTRCSVVAYRLAAAGAAVRLLAAASPSASAGRRVGGIDVHHAAVDEHVSGCGWPR